MTTAQLKTIIGCLLLTAIIAATLLYKHAQDAKAPLHAGCDDYQTIPPCARTTTHQVRGRNNNVTPNWCRYLLFCSWALTSPNNRRLRPILCLGYN